MSDGEIADCIVFPGSPSPLILQKGVCALNGEHAFRLQLLGGYVNVLRFPEQKTCPVECRPSPANPKDQGMAMALVRSEFPEILEERTPSDTPPTNSQKVRTCADCGRPMCLRPKSGVVIGQRAACGAENEGERVKGIAVPTGPKGGTIQVQVVTAETHKEFKRLEPYGCVRPH